MADKWELKHFVLSGILSALIFAVAFVLGSGIIYATGIPATGGIANIFVAVLMMIIGKNIVPKFGFATLTIGIVFTLAIPTIIGGVPGVYKIINGILIGLTLDIVVLISKKSKLGFILAGSFAAVVSIVSIYFAMIIFKLPGAERLAPLLLPLSIMQAVTGALGSLVGLLLYNRRLKNLNTIKRISE